MSPQMARMSASMSSYAAFTPKVSRSGRQLVGTEPGAVPDVEQDDERQDQERVGKDRVGEDDAEAGAQAQRDPDGGEADAQAIQETAAHHSNASVSEQESTQHATRDAQDQDDELLGGDGHGTDPFQSHRSALSLRPRDSWVRMMQHSRRPG